MIRSCAKYAATLTLLLLLILCFCGKPTHLDLVPENIQVVVMDKSKIELDDGDSFVYDGMGIRVLGMDTPEISHPEHGFNEDQKYGREAAALTAEIFHEADEIAYAPYQEDRYGRMLAHVFVDGELLSVKLIKAGLAYETISHYGDNGFPEIAKVIFETAKKSKLKDFIQPYKWRQEHREQQETD